MTSGREREAVRVVIAAPAEAVWSALREPHEIERWHGWHYDDLAAEIDEIFLSDVVEHPDELVLDTNGGGRFELDRADGDSPSTVLRVVRDLDQYGADWDGGYDEIDEGWTTFVHQLRFLLERHPGENRRTLRVDDDRPTSVPVWQMLGLGELAHPSPVAVGERYSLMLPPAGTTAAEQISGEVWFRTPHQLGMTADEWNGLLVVADGPDPEEPGSVLVTTFGDDDAAFAERHRAWEDRWFAAPEDVPGAKAASVDG